MTRTLSSLASLTIKDHTNIIEFVIQNRFDIRNETKNSNTTEKVLKSAGKIAEADTTASSLFSRASRAVAEFDQEVVNVGSSEFRIAIPFITRIIRARDTNEIKVVLTDELQNASNTGALRTGIEIAKEIFDDGLQTIYNDEFWVAAVIMDPRQITGAAGALAEKVKDKAADVAKADIVGAVGGAIAGAIFGGAAGAGKGAVTGAISSSTKEAAE